MIACMDYNIGGTSDVNISFDNFVDACDRDEKRRYVQKCRMALFKKLGAVLYENGYRVRYWPALEKSFYRLIIRKKPDIILAGYMSRNRGLHWDRKRG